MMADRKKNHETVASSLCSLDISTERDGEACGTDGCHSRFLRSLAQLGEPSDMVLKDNVEHAVR